MAIDIVARGMAAGKAITAYDYAKRENPDLTEEEFQRDIGQSARNAEIAAESAVDAEAAADRAEEAAASLEIDTELDPESDNAIANAPVAQALEHKAEINGSYDDLTAGSAEQLLSTTYAEDQEPYHFRTSGGSADIGNRETDMIVGGTVAWNQMVAFNSCTIKDHEIVYVCDISTGEIVANGTASGASANNIGVTFHAIRNHVLYVCGCPQGGSGSTYWLGEGYTSQKGYDYGDGAIFKKVNNDNAIAQIQIMNGVTVSNLVFKPQIFDLTAMFGTEIADYVYSLEQSTEGAGVAWFKKYFQKDYYEYNPGELLSVEGLESHDMVGFNALNPDTHVAKVVGGRQYQITGAYTSITAEDGTIITPDANGLFTPDKTGAVSVAGSGNNTCIHLVWSGYRNGEYEPYAKHSYSLDDSLTLRGIPKIDASGRLYYDGDTYESDGTVTRRYGIVDLGTFTWLEYADYPGLFYVNSVPTNAKIPVSNRVVPSIMAVGYQASISRDIGTSGHTKGEIALANNRIYISNDDFSGDVASFNAAMSGVYLVYELETPTTESADPYTNPQVVDDFGTEEYVTDSIVPVGHYTQYMQNLRDKLQHQPDLASADGDYIVRQNGSQMSLVPMEQVKELPDAPTTDGSYRLVVTVADGNITYSWEANA